MISSEINRRISNRLELAETVDGELTLPPTCLKQTDLKDFYNVQTSIAAFLYFNYFVYEKTPGDVMKMLKKVTLEACRAVGQDLNAEYKAFCERNRIPYRPPSYEVAVMSFEELVSRIEAQGVDAEAVMHEAVEANDGVRQANDAAIY